MRRGFNSADWSMAFVWCVAVITVIASMHQSTKLPTSEEVSTALRAEFNLSIDDTATADGVKKILQHLIKEANRAMGDDFHLMVEWQNLHQIPMATEQDVVDVMNDIQLSKDERNRRRKFKKMVDMSRREINISIDILNDDANWMTAAEAFAKKKLKEHDGHNNIAVVMNHFTLIKSQAYLESVYEANPSWRPTTSGHFEPSRLVEELAAAILEKVVLLLNTCKCQMKKETECYFLADEATCPDVPACVQNWSCEIHSRNATKQHYLRFCKKSLPPTTVSCPKAVCDEGCKSAQRSPVSKCNACGVDQLKENASISEEEENRAAIPSLPREAMAAPRSLTTGEMLAIIFGVVAVVVFLAPFVILAIFLARTAAGKPLIRIEFKRDEGGDDETRMSKTDQPNASFIDAQLLKQFVEQTFPRVFKIETTPRDHDAPFYVCATWGEAAIFEAVSETEKFANASDQQRAVITERLIQLLREAGIQE